jgi:hypothetical protein
MQLQLVAKARFSQSNVRQQVPPSGMYDESCFLAQGGIPATKDGGDIIISKKRQATL